METGVAETNFPKRAAIYRVPGHVFTQDATKREHNFKCTWLCVCVLFVCLLLLLLF